MATHSSILAWRIPWTEEPGGLQSIGSHRVRHDWSNLAPTKYLHPIYPLGILAFRPYFSCLRDQRLSNEGPVACLWTYKARQVVDKGSPFLYLMKNKSQEITWYSSYDFGLNLNTMWHISQRCAFPSLIMGRKAFLQVYRVVGIIPVCGCVGGHDWMAIPPLISQSAYYFASVTPSGPLFVYSKL